MSSSEVWLRTDEEWATFIDREVDKVLADLDNTPVAQTSFSSITSSSDPELPRAIDHTLLKPEATPEQIDQLCEEALKYGFKVSC